MLKRRTPMARTGFMRAMNTAFQARPRIDAEPAPRPIAALLRSPNYARADAMSAAPVEKREYVRSTALLEACRQLRCQHCGIADGTVCAAHSNWGVHGKGGHVKADDNRVASLCFACHSMLDQGSTMLEADRQKLWWFAHILTVHQLVLMSLWPNGVPVPNIAYCPFAWAEDEQ